MLIRYSKATVISSVRQPRDVETDAKHPQFIKAVSGAGYIFTGKIG